MSSSEEFVDDKHPALKTGAAYDAWWDARQEDADDGRDEIAPTGELEDGAWQEELGVNVFGSELWTMPGKGESGPRCGEWQPDSVCSECGDVGYTQHRCGRRECPECWGIWAKESAMRVTRRLQEFRESQPDDWHRQLAHTIASPPEGSIRTLREFKQAWKRAYRLAEEKGMRGGVVVPHPWRVTEAVKREYREEDPDIGIWVWLRGEYGEEWREAVYWSPHFHILGFTTPDMEPGNEEDEWVWRFERSLERYGGPRDLESAEDAYGSVRYLLSHTGFRTDESMKSVRYFGCLAPTSFTDADKPSEGVQSVIERTVEEVADGVLEDEEEGAAGPEDDEDDTECSDEECGGTMIDVFDVEAYLRQAEPGPEVAAVMKVARDWRLGRACPPPGLMRPQTEEEAQEALEAML